MWITFAGGLASIIVGACILGAVAFTTTLADADLYLSERDREYRHIKEIPGLEKQEVREIYVSKGFKGELLDRIVDTVTANKDVWVALMMAEEHRLAPVDRKRALRAAWIVGLSAIIGSLVPLAPFMFLPIAPSMIISVVLTALVLFGIGAYKARVTVGHPARSGLEMAVIGTLSALAGYLVGILLKVPGGI